MVIETLQPLATQEAGAEREARRAESALRSHFTVLPLRQQRVLALHYVAGLSGSEIGQWLTDEPGSIQDDLRAAVDFLRRRLTGESGLAVERCLAPEIFSRVICGHVQAPPGLLERVLERIEAYERERRAREWAGLPPWTRWSRKLHAALFRNSVL